MRNIKENGSKYKKEVIRQVKEMLKILEQI